MFAARNWKTTALKWLEWLVMSDFQEEIIVRSRSIYNCGFFAIT